MVRLDVFTAPEGVGDGLLLGVIYMVSFNYSCSCRRSLVSVDGKLKKKTKEKMCNFIFEPLGCAMLRSVPPTT